MYLSIRSQSHLVYFVCVVRSCIEITTCDGIESEVRYAKPAFSQEVNTFSVSTNSFLDWIGLKIPYNIKLTENESE